MTTKNSYYDYFLDTNNDKKAQETRLNWGEQWKYEQIQKNRDEIRNKYLNLPEFSNSNKNKLK
jgi:hypothetical protein